MLTIGTPSSREPEQPSQPLAIGGRRFHGGGLETELREQRLYGVDRIADVDVLAHPGDGGQFHVPVPRPRRVLQRRPQIRAPEQNRVHSQTHLLASSPIGCRCSADPARREREGAKRRKREMDRRNIDQQSNETGIPFPGFPIE